MSDEKIQTEFTSNGGSYSAECDRYNVSQSDACSTGATTSTPSGMQPGIVPGKDGK